MLDQEMLELARRLRQFTQASFRGAGAAYGSAAGAAEGDRRGQLRGHRRPRVFLRGIVQHRLTPASRHSFFPDLQHQAVNAGIGAGRVAGAIVLHDGLRALVAVAGDVADREQIAAGAIEQHDAGVAQILVVLAVEFAGPIDEEQRRTWLQPPGGFIAIAVATRLGGHPLGKRAVAPVDHPRAYRLVLVFLDRIRLEHHRQSGCECVGKPLGASDRGLRGVSIEEAECSERAGRHHPMPICILVIGLAVVLVDDEFGRHHIELQAQLDLFRASAGGIESGRELRRFLDVDELAGLALTKRVTPFDFTLIPHRDPVGLPLTGEQREIETVAD